MLLVKQEKKVETKKITENEWVIGLCVHNVMSTTDDPPFWTQVKFQKDKGWSDWCGDILTDTDYKILDWFPIPVGYHHP